MTTVTTRPIVPCICGGTVDDHLPNCPQTCRCGRGSGAWRVEPAKHKPGCLLRNTDVRFYDDAVYAKSDATVQIDAIIAKHHEAIALLRSLRVSVVHAEVIRQKADAAALAEFKREVSGVQRPVIERCPGCAAEEREASRGVTFIADGVTHTCARGPRPVEPAPEPTPTAEWCVECNLVVVVEAGTKCAACRGEAPDPRDPHGYDF